MKDGINKDEGGCCKGVDVSCAVPAPDVVVSEPEKEAPAEVVAPKNAGTIIKKYFAPDMKLSDFAVEYKNLSQAERKQLAEGITDGTFEYPV